MKHSLASAATATGISKSTIYRAIKSGKISASFEDGVYKIDPSELHRVFEPVSEKHFMKDEMTQTETGDETALLQLEIDFLKQQLARERNFVESLERRLDESDNERRRLTLLLTHQQKQSPVEKAKSSDENHLWKRIFKK
jgi:hypothetical protein